jgi:hypothetical protein
VLARLDALRELLRHIFELEQAQAVGGVDFFDRHRAAVVTTLGAYGLRTRLPRTFALSQLHYGKSHGSMEDFDRARREISALIEEEMRPNMDPPADA